jgi:outer membrane protein
MKKLLYILLFTIFSSSAYSQTSIFAMEYSMGFASGDLGDYMNTASFRGFTMDYRKMTTPNVGVGFDIGWNAFYEKLPYDTYTKGTVSLSGKQYRYSNHFPMLLAADYFLKPDQELNPYVGLGIGTMYSLRNTDMNLYTLEQDAWQFSLRPEIGFLIQPSPNVALMVCSKYYYGFKGGDLEAQGFFTINVGLVLTQ